jgi:hypothetical protein
MKKQQNQEITPYQIVRVLFFVIGKFFLKIGVARLVSHQNSAEQVLLLRLSVCSLFIEERFRKN